MNADSRGAYCMHWLNCCNINRVYSVHSHDIAKNTIGLKTNTIIKAVKKIEELLTLRYFTQPCPDNFELVKKNNI